GPLSLRERAGVRERRRTRCFNKSMPDPLFSPAALLPPSAVRRRVAVLVVAHVVLNSAQLLKWLLPMSQSTTYIEMGIQSLAVGSMMTLAFWLGMGGG